MVEFQMTYDGELAMTATHGPSGSKIGTDAPKDNQGLGRTFSPTDLVVTGLATCMVTTMAIVAGRSQLEIKGTTVRAEKHMTDQPVRRIGKIVVEINAVGVVDPIQRAKLERAALKCPVHQSLHPDVVVATTFNWN